MKNFVLGFVAGFVFAALLCVGLIYAGSMFIHERFGPGSQAEVEAFIEDMRAGRVEQIDYMRMFNELGHPRVDMPITVDGVEYHISSFDAYFYSFLYVWKPNVIDGVSKEQPIAIHYFTGGARESESTVYVFDRAEYERIMLSESYVEYFDD